MTRSASGNRRRCFLLALLLLPAPWSAAEGPGVCLETVRAGGAGEKAGLLPGDWLVSWSGDAAGPLASPFDLGRIEMEYGPRGRTVLVVERAGQRRSIPIGGGDWRLQARPALAPDELSRYHKGLALAQAGDLRSADLEWRALAATLADQGKPLDAAWLLQRLGRAYADHGQWAGSERAHADARLAAQQAKGDGWPESVALESLAQACERQRKMKEALAASRESERLREALSGGASAALVITLFRLSDLELQLGETAPSDAHARRAVAVGESLEPNSLVLAGALVNAAFNTLLAGDVARGESYANRALEIALRRGPDGLQAARAHVALAQAQESRGQLASAEASALAALATLERVDPNGFAAAGALSQLGAIATDRGNLDEAEGRLKKALAIYERIEPNGFQIAGCLSYFGVVARARGDLALAEASFKRSFAIRESLAPESLPVGISLANLAGLARARGDLINAERLNRRALELKQRFAPDTFRTATTQHDLGEIALARGDLGDAEALFRAALAVRSRILPNTATEAATLDGLGRVCAKAGRAGEAIDYWQKAVKALEGQQRRLGGDAAERGPFEARNDRVYRHLISGLIGAGRAREAFLFLERSRAQSLLAMFKERDLLSGADVPKDLVQLQRVIDTRYDGLQEQLARLSATRDRAQVERLQVELQDLRDRATRLAVRIRAASPRLARLREPEPLDLSGAQASLDSGTALLSYCIDCNADGSGSVLFVVRARADLEPGAAPLVSVTLPVARKELEEEVLSFRSLLEQGHANTALDPALLALGSRLFAELIAPAEPILAKSRRLLVACDGPLHLLPLAALIRQASPRQYVAEWKPLHSIVSATLYAEVRRPRPLARTPDALTFVGFGDPTYSALPGEAPDATQDSIVARASSLKPLPATREEVKGIAGLFSRSAVHLGDDATEEIARALPVDAQYVHFACHSLLSRRRPMDSALALATPKDRHAGENGLLQAFEIFEHVRLDADLVTLSACETAVGPEMGGEGLIGLARAFQYAGARSVLASLWSVSDPSTGDFMKTFYGLLKSGRSKDEALQAAQIGMIHGGATASHPYRWAAFEIIGDWK